MSEVNKLEESYPAGRLSAERILIAMLREKRSWQDYIDITQALWNLRFIADQMKKERDLLFEDSSQDTSEVQGE